MSYLAVVRAKRLLCSPQYLVDVSDAMQASPVASPTRAVSECSYEPSLSAEHVSDSDSDQAASQQPARDISLDAAGHSGDGNLQQPESPKAASNAAQPRARYLLPENSRKSRFRARTLTVQNKACCAKSMLLFLTQHWLIPLLLQLDELSTMTNGVYAFVAAVELPAGRDSVELVHFASGHPALVGLFQQPNGTLKRDALSAICIDLDGGSAVAE